ncbi:MAG: alpha/beta hydrolase [Candidatus Eisenbacteria bacterium]|nr:alpha/beta hydrolase [Candidatus Eisenbacteria bacterium]
MTNRTRGQGLIAGIILILAMWTGVARASAGEGPVLTAPPLPTLRAPGPKLIPPGTEPLLLAPPTLRVAVAPGETLQVTVAGRGDPIILLPGLFGLAYGYRHVTPLLVDAGFQAIVIEPLGIGCSNRPKLADYTLTAQAARLAVVIERLELSPAVVISHGIGSSMALRLALLHPGMVRGIVSIEGGPSETAASPTLGSIMKFAPLLKLVAGEGAIRGKVRSLFEKASGDRSWITEEVIRAYSDPLVADFGSAAASFRAMSNSTEPESLGPNLGRIKVPVDLILGGAPHEHGVPPMELATLRKSLPDFLSVAVPGSGHYIHEEQPAAVLIAVRRVLRRAGRVSRPG